MRPRVLPDVIVAAPAATVMEPPRQSPAENVISPPYYGTAYTLANNPRNTAQVANTNENWSVGDFVGLDNDGNGLPDLADYTVGPFRLLGVVPEGSNLRVTWLTAGGRTNTVQAAGNVSGPYTNLSSGTKIRGGGPRHHQLPGSGRGNEGLSLLPAQLSIPVGLACAALVGWGTCPRPARLSKGIAGSAEQGGPAMGSRLAQLRRRCWPAKGDHPHSGGDRSGEATRHASAQSALRVDVAGARAVSTTQIPKGQ